jgi:geranylgeranyl reductase family protein
MKLWDAIIIGAGPAGCAAAYDLARAGREVLLLDRAEFPRQKACAGGLTTKTVRALRYPVDPVIRQRLNYLRIERDADRSTILRRRSDYCFMTVRKELDDYCFRQTVAVGAEFRRIKSITGINEDADRVEIAVEGQTLRARFLVGADGVHSAVRRLTQGAAAKSQDSSGWFWRAFALEANVNVADTASQDLIFDFATVRDGYGWIFPKGDHVNIGLYSYAADEKIDRARLATYIRSRYGDAPAEDVIGQYAGFGAAHHTISATRIFLVGDAGGFADPLTGEGIYFAIVSGQAAAEAIEAALHSGIPAHRRFQQATERLRADLAVSTSGARWFYGHLDQGYKFLSMPLLRGTAMRAFAEGINLSQLARRARKLTFVRPMSQSTRN